MINTVFYAFIFLFEIAACAFYFEHVLHPKQKIGIRLLSYFGAFVLLFGCSLLRIYALNLTAFVLLVIAMTCFLFRTKLRMCLFHTILLSALMLVTEFASIYLFSWILKASLNVQENNIVVIVTQGSFSKILFFIAVYAVTRIAYRNEKRVDKLRGLALSFSPVASIVVLWLLYDLAVKYNIQSNYANWYMAGTILLLFSNLIVFTVYESTQRVSMEYTQLQLEMQKEKISSEYYELLQEEHESSRILAHDMKGHLRILKGMVTENRSDEIHEYIDKLCSDFRLNEKTVFSGNSYVDVIINRYAQLCRERSVCLNLDVRRASLDFMNGHEITSLLDNLLSNAVEAASNAAEKQVELTICEMNSNFVVFHLRNSCGIAPKTKNGMLISHNPSGGIHGFGIKSIKRITAKYDGEMTWVYKPETKEFEMHIILSKG